MNWYDKTSFIFITSSLDKRNGPVFGEKLINWNSEHFKNSCHSNQSVEVEIQWRYLDLGMDIVGAK